MPQFHNEDDQDLVADLINDAVSPHPNPKEAFVPAQSFCTRRARLSGESTDVLIHPSAVFGFERGELSLSAGQDFNAVGQSSPSSLRARS